MCFTLLFIISVRACNQRFCNLPEAGEFGFCDFVTAADRLTSFIIDSIISHTALRGVLRMSENITNRPGKVTMAEIARVANVTKSTVSLVLNNSPHRVPISDATRQRVLEAAKRLGYRPNAAAKALATGRSNTILMVAFDLWDENFIERLKGAEEYLVPAGYSTRMCTVDAKGGLSAYTEILRTGQADGVLLSGMATHDTYPILKELCREADTVGVPIVSLANAFPDEYISIGAYVDDKDGAEKAVMHLIGHGHRRILLLGIEGQQFARNREQGYRTALENAGIPIDPELIVLGKPTQMWAYETTLKIAKSLDFTAMFVMIDNMAIAALSALKASGKRVPEDCALVGFDNNEKFARFTDPPITTIDNPFFETGKRAAELLVDIIDKKDVKTVILPVDLVVRQSCGCPG